MTTTKHDRVPSGKRQKNNNHHHISDSSVVTILFFDASFFVFPLLKKIFQSSIVAENQLLSLFFDIIGIHTNPTKRYFGIQNRQGRGRYPRRTLRLA
jgi:hypothetical protein